MYSKCVHSVFDGTGPGSCIVFKDLNKTSSLKKFRLASNWSWGSIKDVISQNHLRRFRSNFSEIELGKPVFIIARKQLIQFRNNEP